MENKKFCVLSLSGGMDSSTLLLHLLAKGYSVTALSFNYGQKHNVELERAKSLVEYINDEWHKTHPVFDNDKNYNYYPVTHQVITLDGLSQLLNSSLVTGGEEVPEGHYAQDNMKATVVPNRNKIFASLIQAVALSIAEKNNSECAIAMGIHAGDHAIYPDCRQEFRDADFEAFKIGNWGSEKVTIVTPYLEIDKFGILQDGEKCCEQLGLSFDDVYSRTNTSYKPILLYAGLNKITSETVMPQVTFNSSTGVITNQIDVNWKWYSDYKSAASVERLIAFSKLGRKDPVEYADETGPVSFETAITHALKIENNFNLEQAEKSTVKVGL